MIQSLVFDQNAVPNDGKYVGSSHAHLAEMIANCVAEKQQSIRINPTAMTIIASGNFYSTIFKDVEHPDDCKTVDGITLIGYINNSPVYLDPSESVHPVKIGDTITIDLQNISFV